MARCKSCTAAIKWEIDYMGKYHPVNLDGSCHYLSCPNTKHYRKLKEATKKKDIDYTQLDKNTNPEAFEKKEVKIQKDLGDF